MCPLRPGGCSLQGSEEAQQFRRSALGGKGLSTGRPLVGASSLLPASLQYLLSDLHSNSCFSLQSSDASPLRQN